MNTIEEILYFYLSDLDSTLISHPYTHGRSLSTGNTIKDKPQRQYIDIIKVQLHHQTIWFFYLCFDIGKYNSCFIVYRELFWGQLLFIQENINDAIIMNFQ